MGTTTGRKLLRVILGNLRVVKTELQANPWYKPLFSFMTTENATNPESPKLEQQQENQRRWLAWRHCLKVFLLDQPR